MMGLPDGRPDPGPPWPGLSVPVGTFWTETDQKQAAETDGRKPHKGLGSPSSQAAQNGAQMPSLVPKIVIPAKPSTRHEIIHAG